MASLYELTGDYAKFAEIMEQGELDEEMQSALNEALENMVIDIEDKLEGYAKVIKNFESDIAGLRAEEERLFLKRKTLENRIKNMKLAMTRAMVITGKRKIKTPLFSFIIQKSPGSIVLDEQYIENIPEKYLIPQEPQINKKLMLEDLKNGIVLPDLEGIAHIEQPEGVRIR